VLPLTKAEADFLDALRGGETAKAYAARLNYSPAWAEWMSRKVRQKLDVGTIGEAVEMSEFAGLEGRLNDLSRKLDSALEAFSKATTPAEKEAATAKAEGAQADLSAELRLRGLTLKDLDALQEQKFQAKVDERISAQLAERDKVAAEEAAAAAELDNGDVKEKNLGEKILDGLGGVRNVKP